MPSAHSFAESYFAAHGKNNVCRVFWSRHSAKLLFVECPSKRTLQTPWHSAKNGFPVVVVLTSGMYAIYIFFIKQKRRVNNKRYDKRERVSVKNK